MVASFYKWWVFTSSVLVINFIYLEETFKTVSNNEQVTASQSHFMHVAGMRPAPHVHPFYVSVTEINHNEAEKSLEISCKIFTDDMEKTLKQNYKTKIDIIKPTDKEALAKMMTDYMNKNLKISVDGKAVTYRYIGNETDDANAYVYLQVDNIPQVKKIEIINSVLYDFIDKQINIMHVVVNGTRKSSKLEFPDKHADFNF